MTQKDITLFFAWCWFGLLKKRESRRQIKLRYLRMHPEGAHEQEINRAAGRRYYAKNRELCLEKQKQRRVVHPEDVAEINRRYQKKNLGRLADYMRRWRDKNRLRARSNKRAWDKKQRETRPWFRIRGNLSGRLRGILRGKGEKSESTARLVGCSAFELVTHLQKQFLPGMSWENYGKWHVDHVKPCSAFNLTDPEQQRVCFNYTNLQPLWALDNLRKGGARAA